jgi:hypothetical protein
MAGAGLVVASPAGWIGVLITAWGVQGKGLCDVPMTRFIVLLETLGGEDHPDWHVRDHKVDAVLIAAFQNLSRIEAADGVHFRPRDMEEWRRALSAVHVRGDPDRAGRLLRLLENDANYWILVHALPFIGPLGSPLM